MSPGDTFEEPLGIDGDLCGRSSPSLGRSKECVPRVLRKSMNTPVSKFTRTTRPGVV
jgi:hypothetical protein